MALEEYDYELPAELLAHTPAEPRDSARLFVYDTKTGEIIFDTFRNLAKYIPERSLLVLNNTKVVPARIAFEREDGRITEGLVLVNEASDEGTVRALIRRGAKIGEVLWLGGRKAECLVRVITKDEKVFVLALENPEKLETTLFKFGGTPLPGYIHTPLTEEEARTRYQSVFAENPASVAAPTASLHFTERVFVDLDAKGIGRATVTLHVGMGTFAPVTDEHLASGTLHRERYEVGEDAAQNIARAKREGRAVVAVGTTAMRALESAWRNVDSLPATAYRSTEAVRRWQAGTSVPSADDRTDETTIFIRKPYAFRVPDMLITNFHLPKSSLMVLVDAFLADKNAPHSLVELYCIAIKNNFRFYSFGDAMLIK